MSYELNAVMLNLFQHPLADGSVLNQGMLTFVSMTSKESVARNIFFPTFTFPFSNLMRMQDDSEKYSRREKEIAHLLEDGRSRKMIADVLNISLNTVRTLNQRLYGKAHVHSVTEFLKYKRIHPELFDL